GGARSALFCWAFARRARRDGIDGRFLIRIEDTDQTRSSDESARGILEDLAWLGIEWDDGPELKVAGESSRSGETGGTRTIGGDPRGVGPFFQARRVALYNAHIDALAHAGRAYPAFETPEELDARRRDAIAAKRTYRYERPADVLPGVFHEQRWSRARSGERHVVRFVFPEEEVIVHDSILGDVRTAPGELDDLVIRKADGFPTYHFAVVIDDELMGVTHVLRAQEHLANTPRHVAMQRALRRLDNGRPFTVPVYGHMPVICNMDGSKMSKRDKAKAARKAARDAMARDPSITAATLGSQTGMGEPAVSGFLAGENDSAQTAEALAGRFNVPLPEIEIWDFRRSGYLPEVIVNFVALLGWNPGMKDADGKDLEKFDLPFIAEHFSIDRVGRSSSKFDRAKLLSFNADAIAAMT
nr:glutamate--tRNA ligase family protein [Phycisphaerales bacterium]